LVGLLLDFTGDGAAATATGTAAAASPPATAGLLPVPVSPSGAILTLASGRLVSMTSPVTSLEEELGAGAFAAFSMYERGMVSVMGGRVEEGVGAGEGEAGAEGGAESSDRDHLSRRLPLTVSTGEEMITSDENNKEKSPVLYASSRVEDGMI
jgi:hypothetical protein